MKAFHTDIPGVVVYESPISLPESVSGKLSIKHITIEEADIVSMREAILTGKKAQKVLFKPARIVHQLADEDRGVWMTDLPIELRQAAEAIDTMAPYGHILVGGLGLGVIATWLAEFCDKVTVVERSIDVITLASVGLPANVEVVQGDIYEYLKNLQEWPFDMAYFDTWQGTNEGTWWTEVFPIRRIIGRKFGYKQIYNWAEDIMLGQIMDKLTFAQGQRMIKAFEESGQDTSQLVWRPHWYYKNEQPLTLSEARFFVNEPGTLAWEEAYGALYPYDEMIKTLEQDEEEGAA